MSLERAERSGTTRRSVQGLYALSGAVSLGYQVCWFRIFVDFFGASGATFALVVACFIGGLGAGALTSRRFVAGLAARTGIDSPLRLYGLIELGVAATAAATLASLALPATAPGVFPYVLDDGLYQLPLGQRFGTLIVVMTLVSVPCFAMGTTFPLLCQAFGATARFPSSLYAWNTFGACLGILACEFLLFPIVGHERAFALFVVANAGLGALFLSGALRASGTPASAGEPVGRRALTRAGLARPPLDLGALVVLAAAGGFLTGGLEADLVRRIRFTSFRSEAAMSFVSFWAVVAIFLGSATVRWLPRLSLGAVRLGVFVALGLYAAGWWLRLPLERWAIERFGAPVAGLSSDLPGQLATLYRSYSGLSPTVAFTAITVVPAFFLLSWLLPFACDHLHERREHLGRVYGINTLAFCAGTLGFGWLAPHVDIFYSTKLFLAVFGVGAVWLLVFGARPSPLGAGVGALACLAAVFAVQSGFDPSYFPPGDPAVRGRVSELRSDGETTTFVVDEGSVRHLYFDAFSMSATTPGAQRYMRLMAHFPLLAQRDPARALVICFGVGNTASAVASHDSIEAIDVVDLDHQVLRTAPAFAHTNRLVYRDSRLRAIHDDGRRFLEVTPERYDLVTSEPPPPRHEGIYRLYSVEYYRDVLSKLTPTGVMTQWLTVRQMPPEAVELAIRSFVEVFPHALLFVGAQYDFILMGSPEAFDPRIVEERFAQAAPAVRADLEGVGVRSAVDLLARIVRSDGELRGDVGAGRVLSDRRNDWSYLFFGGAGPAVVAYDPVAVWQQIGLDGLEDAERLARVTRNLGLLRAHVQDFPLETLASVRRSPHADQIEGTRVDWERIRRINQGAFGERDAGALAEAAEGFRTSLAELDDQLQIWVALAEVEQARGRFAEAATAWRAYLERAPEDPGARYQLGRALLAAGDGPGAVDALESARRVLPGAPEVERALAAALMAAGRPEEAAISRGRASELAPGPVGPRGGGPAPGGG